MVAMLTTVTIVAMVTRAARLILPAFLVLFRVTPPVIEASTTLAGKCTATKSKAAGKKASSLLKAVGKNLSKGDSLRLAQDVSKAQSKFTKSFTKAESKGGCLATDDAAAIEAKVDAFVVDVFSPDDDVTVANLNILHGLFCPSGCRLTDRIDLFFEWVVGSGCPDVITLQEITTAGIVPLLDAQRETVCPFPYVLLDSATTAVDDTVILSRYPILESEVLLLLGNFRHALYARIDHPLGPLDVFTTHLSSGSDGGDGACGVSCPTECLTAGAVTRRDCQAVQLAEYVESKRDVTPPAVVTGDFNNPPGSFVYDQFADRGWTDTYLAVGNPECNPVTGVGCTSGRDSSTVSEIESTVANVSSRIDYTFLVPPDGSWLCTGALDPASDDDGDGTATRIFADDPNPFAACGATPLPVCWPSDHEGSEMDLNCD